MSEPVKVLPKTAHPLTDKGTVWESGLWAKGWNNLPPEQRYGFLADDPDFKCVRVYWPAINYISVGILRGELQPYEGS